MIRQDILTLLMPYHKLNDTFDYNLAIEWAMRRVEAGDTGADMLMLASFEADPDKFEIIPYLDRVITAAEASPENAHEGIMRLALLFCNEIVQGNAVRSNLSKIYSLYYPGYPLELQEMSHIAEAWDDFFRHNQTFSYYYDTTPELIEDDIKMEAQKFIDTYFGC